MDEVRLQRRVAGWHDLRLDGLTDLLLRARGASVLDLGCNRGMIGLEFAWNGARLVHGLDIYPEGIATARGIFADMRGVQSQFEVGDLTRGRECLRPFGDGQYDVVLLLGTYHKIERPPTPPLRELGMAGMTPAELSSLMRHLGTITGRYFAARGGNFTQLDEDLGAVGLTRIHTSEISELGPTAIWRRGGPTAASPKDK